jgi:lipopolysaccharide transport system ATP-binding protein
MLPAEKEKTSSLSENKGEVVVSVKNVSKKFCKSLKRSMAYGIIDLSKNLLGIKQDSSVIKKDEFWALEDINFELRRGETLGLIGPNGSGKTTLLRLLAGIFPPDKGEIKIKGRVGALIAVGAGFHPYMTGRENIFLNGTILGMTHQEIRSKFDEIVDFADIGDFLGAPVSTYSSGMRVRLGFSIATAIEPDVLLIDEILAVGDEGFQKKCLNKIGELKKAGTAIVFVSHNMHMISAFSNRLIMMNNGLHKEYESPALGVQAYKRLCIKTGDQNIERLCNGNGSITFYNVAISANTLRPGDSFYAELIYDTNTDYLDADVDIAISTSRETSFYFQATNKAFNKVIDLKKENKSLLIQIKDIKLNNVTGKVNIAVWSHNRGELLFWWRIPFESYGMGYATGSTWLDVSYKIK